MCTASGQGCACGHAGTMWCDCEGELGAQRANSASDKQIRAVSVGATRGPGVEQAFAFAFDEHCKN